MVKRIFDSVLIVADDFTGVNDTVVQFSKLGLTSITTLNLDLVHELIQEHDVVGVTTESRSIVKEKSYSILYSLGEKVKDIFDNILFYKKVDSTLRGNIVPEIVGLVDALNPDLIVFAPAFPKQGRITRDGVHLVNGVPVEKTYFGKDLRSPVKSSHLPSYFEPIFGTRYRHINLQELRKEDLKRGIGEFKILSFDVENDLDLKNIVQQILSSEKRRIIWVGSAGLAEQLAYNSIVGSVEGKPVLMAVGSVNEVSRNQVIEFTKVFPTNVIQVNVHTLVKDFGKEGERIVDEVSRNLKFSNDIIIATSYTREQVEEGVSLAKELGLNLSDFGSILAEKFGLLVSHIISFFGKDSFCGIYMTGGDIAVSVIKHLKLESFKILGEIEPGLPLLLSKDLLIVTKAGGFGGSETLIKVSTRLKSVNKRCLVRSQ